jgi:hypothetical protein
MSDKNRNARRRSTQIAMVGAAATTAVALAAVMAAPEPPVVGDVKLAAAASPFSTQGMTNWSRTFDNSLLFMGSFGGAAAAFWNPIAGMSGGWLPTFTARTTQRDLSTSEGLLGAGGAATKLNVVPGVSGDATTTILAATAETVSPVPGTGDEVEAAVDTILIPLASIRQVIDALNGLNDAPLVGHQLAGIPSVEDLLDVLGLTATQTTFESTYQWPIFGLDGTTHVGNTFIQLPRQTATTLAARLGERLTIGGRPVSEAAPEVQQVVGNALAPLDNIVATPTVTAWIPAGSSTLHTPIGSAGGLAAVPMVAVGPVAALSAVPLPDGLPDTTQDTAVVVAPIGGWGIESPYGIASFGILTAPGVITPAATFFTPPVPVSYSRLSTPSSTYVGTNGVNYNSGGTIGLLITPVGLVPLVYTLGSFNAGATGLGFTAPSLFGTTPLPPVQVGTAPTRQSADPVAAALSNLGVPDQGEAITAALNSPVSTAVEPLSPQLTKALNGSFGPAASEIARRLVTLTELLNQASQAIPSPSLPNGSGVPVSTPPANPVPNDLFTGSAPVVPSRPLAAVADIADNEDVVLPDGPQPRKLPRLDLTSSTDDQDDGPVFGNRTSTNGSRTNAPGGLRSTVQNAPKRVTDTVRGTVKSVTDKVSDAVGSLGKDGDEG